MKALTYQYDPEDLILVIEDLQDGRSVYDLADVVLAQIEVEIGPLVNQHILWQSANGLWDLVLSETLIAQMGIGIGVGIYPLGVRTLEQAKARLAHLIAQGLIPGIVGRDLSMDYSS